MLNCAMHAKNAAPLLSLIHYRERLTVDLAPATRDSVLQRQMQLSVECHILVMAQKRPERAWCVCVCVCRAVVLMLD